MSSSVQSSLPAPALQASKAALNAALSDIASSEPGEVQEIEVDMALQAETLKTVFNDPKNFNVKVRVFLFSLSGRISIVSPPFWTRLGFCDP